MQEYKLFFRPVSTFSHLQGIQWQKSRNNNLLVSGSIFRTETFSFISSKRRVMHEALSILDKKPGLNRQVDNFINPLKLFSRGIINIPPAVDKKILISNLNSILPVVPAVTHFDPELLKMPGKRGKNEFYVLVLCL